MRKITYVDDLELAAWELYVLSGNSRYLDQLITGAHSNLSLHGLKKTLPDITSSIPLSIWVMPI